MDIETFLSGFEILSYFGITLNSEKRLLLYNSLILLQNDAHLNKIFFWGIIQGMVADYYVVYGYEKDTLTGRVFYYSINGLDWFILTEPKPIDIKYARMCDARFQGDPSFAVQIEFDDPNSDEVLKKISEEQNPEEEKIAENLQAEEDLEEGVGDIDGIKSEGKIKEEDRLAAVICIINEEAFVLPRGALFKRYDEIVVENKAFQGLVLLECDELRNYLHYRRPHEKWNTNILTRKDYNYATDFLDTIDSDKPSGIWRMRLINGMKTLYLQHLLWPGYIFYHVIETPIYGSFYCGNGKNNLDVPFML